MELFYAIMARLLVVSAVENKVDKNGKPFLSAKFCRESQAYHFTLKSLVVYNDPAKGVVKLFINAGAVRYGNNKQFPISRSILLKKMVNYSGYAVYSRNEWLGSVNEADVNKLITLGENVTPESTQNWEDMF